MHLFSSQHKVGILGGGQLGKMLLYTTRKFDIQTYVLDPNPEAPSKIACDAFFVGDLMDYETVFEFGKKVDTLTIEIENVNVSALRALENEGVNVYPAADTLAIIKQNKNYFIVNMVYLLHHLHVIQTQKNSLPLLKMKHKPFPSFGKVRNLDMMVRESRLFELFRT